jgi:hypothetical protein
MEALRPGPQRATRRSSTRAPSTGLRYSARVKHFKKLILAAVVACVGLAVVAPASALAASKKCHWDKKTGSMICQRPPR